MVAAVEKEYKKIGRIRLQVVPDCSGDILEQAVKTSAVSTDGWKGCNFLDESRYTHVQVVAANTAEKESVLPGVIWLCCW